MQPTPPPSLPRRPLPPPILTRGRSPAPKPFHHHRSRSSSTSSASSSSTSSSSLSTFRSDSPELMFPMSPVLSDEKHPFATATDDDDDENERHIRYTYPIIVNLESAIPQRKMRLPTPSSLSEKENQNPYHHHHGGHHHHRRRSIVKPEPLNILPPTPIPTPFPTLKPKTSTSRVRDGSRLASFLHHPATTTRIPSVSESPTAVTVHRSGPSLEHVTTVSQPPSPSQPMKILSRSPPPRREQFHVPEIEKAMMMRNGGGHFDELFKKIKKTRN